MTGSMKKVEGWDTVLREKEMERTEHFMSKNQCPRCARKYLYFLPKTEELTTFPAGRGYISIRGCTECRYVFYNIVEDK